MERRAKALLVLVLLAYLLGGTDFVLGFSLPRENSHPCCCTGEPVCHCGTGCCGSSERSSFVSFAPCGSERPATSPVWRTDHQSRPLLAAFAPPTTSLAAFRIPAEAETPSALVLTPSKVPIGLRS
jgi:hypothetical protein